MGRLLILIFPKVRNARLLGRSTVSVPECIRRGGRVRTARLRFDLTQTETFVPEKRPPFFFALSLSLSANATGFARLLASMLG